MATCHQSRINHIEVIGMQDAQSSDQKVRLTFWEGLQLLATTQIERLERCASADGCQSVIESVHVAKSVQLRAEA